MEAVVKIKMPNNKREDGKGKLMKKSTTKSIDGGDICLVETTGEYYYFIIIFLGLWTDAVLIQFNQ